MLDKVKTILLLCKLNSSDLNLVKTLIRDRIRWIEQEFPYNHRKEPQVTNSLERYKNLLSRLEGK